jgi:chaperonin GroES
MNSQDTEQPLAKMLDSINIAESLDEDELNKIGKDAFAGYDLDFQSRTDWEKSLDQWTDLAKQVVKPKTYPWPKASNIKYPLLSTAAMQFAARAYPSLLPSSGKIVNSKPVGKDPQGQKTQVAEAISTYMSIQLLEEMDGWEEDMDKLLIMLPIIGTMFKKTYWDALKEKPCSHIVMPKNLVVNYWTRNLKDSERISEIMEVSPRKLKERQQAGLWLDIDLGRAPQPVTKSPAPVVVDETTPFTIIEQHTFLDLDKDGYSEPYIVTFHKESHKVLRIVARFDEKSIEMTDKGKIKRIVPTQYYTKFGFIPNPDGGFYDIGFGVLLGPLNESVNTLINQLLDSGHLSTLQSGFIGKGLRLRMGETRFQPGEWKAVNSTGADLKQQIVPLPTKEPSNVLFQLMGSLITSGKELASVAEIFVGKMPGQNTPATTTMATIEQGLKVFTAVYKRLYRSLTEEFLKLARINNIYLDPATESGIAGVQINPGDFDIDQHKIFPNADPTAISQTEKLMKAQGLMELLQTGVLDPVKVVTRVLDAQEQPNWQELLNQQVAQTGQLPPPPPDPKLLETQAKVQAIQQKSEIDQQNLAFKQSMEQRDAQFKQAMDASNANQEMRHKEMMTRLEAAIQIHNTNIKTATDNAKMMQELTHNEVSHQQNTVHTEVAHKQQMAHNAQVAQQKASEPSKGAKK